MVVLDHIAMIDSLAILGGVRGEKSEINYRRRKAFGRRAERGSQDGEPTEIDNNLQNCGIFFKRLESTKERTERVRLGRRSSSHTMRMID